MDNKQMQLKADISAYSETIPGCWLMDFDWRKVKIKTLPAGVEGVVQAAYLALSNSIVCAADKNDGVFFGSVVHELFHSYQRHEMGLVNYALAKAFSRKTIEQPAKQAEINAVEWYGFQRLGIVRMG